MGVGSMGHGLPGVLSRDRGAMAIATETPAVIATGDLSILHKSSTQGSALMGTTIPNSRDLTSLIAPKSKALTMKLDSKGPVGFQGGPKSDGVPGVEQLHGRKALGRRPPRD